MTHVAVVTQNADLESDIRPREEAQALAAAGYRVTLVGGARNPENVRRLLTSDVRLAAFDLPEAATTRSEQVREQGQAFIRAAVALHRLARARSIDIVHGANPPDNIWLIVRGLKSAQPNRPKFVFDQHDVAPVLLEEKYGRTGMMRPLHALACWLEEQSFALADLVVFTSPEYETRARKERLLQGSAVVVPNGWSLPNPGVSDDWRFGGRHVVAYVGSINEQDGVDHLVEAVATLRNAEGLRVVVVGDGAALPTAKARAKALRIDGLFTWLGWIRDRRTLAAIVHAADVCVAPEVDSEFNRLARLVKVSEYMSAGRPIVAHELPQTMAVAGDTVLYAADMTAASLGSAIAEALENPQESRQRGERARVRFDNEIAWSAVGARRLVEAYRGSFGR